MLIDIESYYGNYLLHGKKLKISEIQSFMKSIEDGRDLVSVFCSRFDYEILPYDAYIITDLTIDLDTASVFVHKKV